MKEDILKKAGELFLNLGFKSVTMDDIANELGISKKTIYKYFKNKDVLVDESTTIIQETCHQVIEIIIEQNHNPIKETFEIKKMFREMFKNAGSSPIYQLKKYYPKTHEKVISREMCAFSDCITDNIKKGIEQGYYRADTEVEHAVQFYFAIVFYIHENYTLNEVTDIEIKALEYHTRAIATPEGLEELKIQLNNQ